VTLVVELLVILHSVWWCLLQQEKILLITLFLASPVTSRGLCIVGQLLFPLLSKLMDWSPDILVFGVLNMTGYLWINSYSTRL